MKGFVCTQPLFIHRIEEDASYIEVTTGYGVARCKKALLKDAAQTKHDLNKAHMSLTMVVLKTFEPWNPAEWFIDFDVIESPKGIEFNNPIDYPNMKLIEEAVGFAMKQFKLKDINLSVNMSDTIQYKDSILGQQTSLFNHHYITIKPTSDRDQLLDTIFHEMRHVDQMVKAALMYTDGKSLWKGMINDNPNEYQDWTNTEYWYRPWEMDARKAAAILVKRWKQVRGEE